VYMNLYILVYVYVCTYGVREGIARYLPFYHIIMC
jgi:hypothetical protein